MERKSAAVAVAAAIVVTASGWFVAIFVRNHLETLKAHCPVSGELRYGDSSLIPRDYDLPAQQHLLECDIARTKDNIGRHRREVEKLFEAGMREIEKGRLTGNQFEPTMETARSVLGQEEQYLRTLDQIRAQGPNYREMRKSMGEWNDRCNGVAVQEHPERKDQCVIDGAVLGFSPVY